MDPECHYQVVHFSVSQHTGWMALPNQQWQQIIWISTAYAIASLLHLSKEKQRVVWVGCQSSPGIWTCELPVNSPGICWQQRNCELKNLTVLQILKAVVGLSHSLGSTCCISTCFHPGLSLPPPWPGPLRLPQASSAGFRAKTPEEYQHGSQPNLNWRLSPPYPHLLPAQLPFLVSSLPKHFQPHQPSI